MTIAAFVVMALGALAVVLTLPLHSFWLFLGFFLLLFVASGAGNGATYRMIPTLFALRSGTDGHSSSGGAATQRAAAAALGIVSAIGAYGGFLVPQALGLSKAATGGYAAGLGWFVVAYVVLCAVTTSVLLRGRRRGARI